MSLALSVFFVFFEFRLFVHSDAKEGGENNFERDKRKRLTRVLSMPHGTRS